MSGPSNRPAPAGPPVRTTPWRVAIGPLASLVAGVALHLLDRTAVPVSNPGVWSLLLVVFSAYFGGIGSGLLSSLVVVALAIFFHPEPSRLLDPQKDPLWRLLTLAIAAPAVTLMVGTLRRRGELEAQRAAAAEAEEALRLSEARKAGILHWALDGIIDMDEEGRVTEFNPAAERMFGYTREEALGRELADLIVSPSMREAHRRGVECWRESGEGRFLGRRVELTGIRRDGSQFPMELTIIDIPTGGKRTCTGFVRDVTVRTKAEEALRASERNYRLLMEQASDGILISDHHGNYIDANPKMSELLGYTREELLTLSVHDLVPEDEKQRLPLRLEELRAGHEVLVERWMQRKDGSRIPVEISAKRLDAHRLQGIYRDISGRKQQEEQLKQALSVLSATLDSTADGILVVDLQGRISTFNKKFVELWRIPEEITATRDDSRALAFVLDQLKDPELFLGKVRELYAQPEAESFDVIEFKDGRILERYSMPYRIGGVSGGRVWSFRDVTDRQRAEAALRHSEEQLLQAQKMEAIGRLAGGVAHDFNNLLTVILGNCSLMLQDLAPGDPMRQGAEEIARAAERAAALTRQLLAFGRKQVLELTVLDLNAVVTDMLKMLERVIGEHIRLIVRTAPRAVCVRADRGQLEQVILNLVVNARDAMPRGGTVLLEAGEVELDETFAQRDTQIQPGRFAMLAVSDSGVGMDEATQARIFEPFFTTKERGKGTGLGLATVYGIVRQCEGTIWVYSRPGVGSTFKVYLPSVDDQAPTITPRAAAPRAATGSETVLLVEDEAMVRELIRSTLTQRGYRVLEAVSGSDALRISHHHRGPLDLLVTDVVMPGMSGPELAGRLAEERKGLKVLYVSGYTDDAIVHHGVLEPGVAFLQKPFSLDALARKVREALDAPPGPP